MSNLENPFDTSDDTIEENEAFLEKALEEEESEEEDEEHDEEYAFRGGGRTDDPYEIFTQDPKNREFSEDLYAVDEWEDSEMETRDNGKRPKIFNPNEYISIVGTSQHKRMLEDQEIGRDGEEYRKDRRKLDHFIEKYEGSSEAYRKILLEENPRMSEIAEGIYHKDIETLANKHSALKLAKVKEQIAVAFRKEVERNQKEDDE